MSERVPLPTIAGLLSGFVGVDLFAGHFSSAARLVGFQPAVTDAPSGGSIAIDLRTATGGGGSGLSATIADGARFPASPVSGAIDIAAGTDLYLRITSQSGGALGLYGQFLVEPDGGATAALTTLSQVKEYLIISGTGDDGLLTRIIAGVSLKMQTYMRRAIVAESIVGEKHSAEARTEAIVLESYPIDVNSLAVTLSTTLLDATEYDADSDTGLLYYTPGDGDPTSWPAGRRHISIDYDAGFATVPADIQNAATVQCAWEHKRVKRLGERTSVIGENTATFLVDAWAPDVVPVLDTYRARVIR